MKRIPAFLLSLLLIFTLSIPCFAAEPLPITTYFNDAIKGTGTCAVGATVKNDFCNYVKSNGKYNNYTLLKSDTEKYFLVKTSKNAVPYFFYDGKTYSQTDYLRSPTFVLNPTGEMVTTTGIHLIDTNELNGNYFKLIASTMDITDNNKKVTFVKTISPNIDPNDPTPTPPVDPVNPTPTPPVDPGNPTPTPPPSVSDGFFNSFWDKLGDFLLSIVVPDEAYLNSWMDKLRTKFETQSGILTYPITLLLNVETRFKQLKNADPIFTIPDIQFMGVSLFPHAEYNLKTLLNEPEISKIYNIYILCVKASLSFGLVRLALKKSHEIFGGG